MEFGIATVITITVMCYLMGQIVKNTRIDNKWIPVTCGVAGLLLGIAALYIGVPDFPARDPLTAAAVGVASGLSATGFDQAAKQIRK